MRIRFYKLAAVLSMCVLLAGCRDKGPSEVELARNEGISYMEQADYCLLYTSPSPRDA